MKKENADIRSYAKSSNVPLWRIARELGCSEQTFLRWLRDELPVNEKQRIMRTINELSRDGE